MKNSLLFLALLVFCYSPVFSQSSTSKDMQHDENGHVMLNKNDLKWMDAPPGLPKGAKIAVLSGDPAKEGMFVMRVMLPENYKVPPHWHPADENVSVIEGNLYMGQGEQFDEVKATKLQEQGYSKVLAKVPHYAFTKGKCLFEVNAMGPFGITYINPADDPRPKQ
jgi:hypothetical protein